MTTLQLEPVTQPPDADPPRPPGLDAPDAPRRQPRRALASALACLLIGAAGGGFAAHELVSSGSTTTTATSGLQAQPAQPSQPVQPNFGTSGTTSGTAGDGPANAASIASKVSPAVVDINTTVGYEGGEAAGTGIVLTSTGEILTNNHVITGATSISVTDVGNGRTYKATVVGYDKSDDVAVLQLQGASGLATATTATTAAQVGDSVVGVGNAGGTGGTPSYAGGVITATGQSITASDSSDGTEQLTGLLETDANIVAGDSGGPLVNTSGQVVGMDTAASAGFRFSQTSQAYAIPISTALQIAQQIESGQASSTIHLGATAMIGIGVQPDSSGYGFGRPGGTGQGATVAQVLSGGPAANAGIVAGDTIIAVAGQTVTSAESLSRIVLQQQPGTTVTVRYVDTSGASHTTTVRLTTGPPQ